MSKVTLETVRRSVVVRPITEVYLLGVAMLVLAVNGVLSLAEALVIFGMTSMMILLVNVYGELLQVHSLVNSQHEDVCARMVILLDTMHEAGVPVPEAAKQRQRQEASR